MTELSVHEVRAAQLRIQPHVHRTPVITCRHLDRLTGRQLFFKAENLQKTGSFKARGACNAVFAIKERRPDVPGIVTHSSGNHGQATAYAAALAGLPCTVVVPRDTAAVKVDAIRAYGAHVLLCEPTVDARYVAEGTVAPPPNGSEADGGAVAQWAAAVRHCGGTLSVHWVMATPIDTLQLTASSHRVATRPSV
ncbi:putative serine racemase [Amphibalanus amphitrite]|uniref:L-serine ammonia-lyase n=1 Tax=Amphibalanus amphitrite TaxID=1232801 RepID=A0A6A4WID8_AMPAM|nr:putative serine racemase [Amphibalanus amphitrite]